MDGVDPLQNAHLTKLSVLGSCFTVSFSFSPLVLGEKQVNNHLVRKWVLLLYFCYLDILWQGPILRIVMDWRIPWTLRKHESSEQKLFWNASIKNDSNFQSFLSLLKGTWTKFLFQPQKLKEPHGVQGMAVDLHFASLLRGNIPGVTC